MIQPPTAKLSLKHLALNIIDLAACELFYVTILGMQVVWRPDADNIYLSCGEDNLALHRAPADFAPNNAQRLAHLGFCLPQQTDLTQWYQYLMQHKVPIIAPIKNHRDGSSSFYCADPDGNIVQILWLPSKLR
jgi:catechol-2,3-dioxygenase